MDCWSPRSSATARPCSGPPAAALLGTLVPVGFAGAWMAHPHSPADTGAARDRRAAAHPGRKVPRQAADLGLGVGNPRACRPRLVVRAPAGRRQAAGCIPGADARAPGGLGGVVALLRMTVLSIALESAALTAAMLRHGGSALSVLETAAGIVVLAVVGLMVFSQLVALREARAAAEADAYTDPLTGARSRRYGLVRLQAELDLARTRAAPEPRRCSDIDRFAGQRHAWTSGRRRGSAGSSAVHSTLRPGDELIRWGGEEFLISSRNGRRGHRVGDRRNASAALPTSGRSRPRPGRSRSPSRPGWPR